MLKPYERLRLAEGQNYQEKQLKSVLKEAWTIKERLFAKLRGKYKKIMQQIQNHYKCVL